MRPFFYSDREAEVWPILYSDYCISVLNIQIALKKLNFLEGVKKYQHTELFVLWLAQNATPRIVRSGTYS